MTTTVADVLNTAADLIEQRGKATGLFVNQRGELCAVAAIRWVVYGVWMIPADATPAQNDLVERTRQRVLDWLTAGTDVPASIVNWSDNSTQAEVVAGLREAAKAAS